MECECVLVAVRVGELVLDWEWAAAVTMRASIATRVNDLMTAVAQGREGNMGL